MPSQKVVFYVHGTQSGEKLSAQLAARPGVISVSPLNVAENPEPGGDQRNEAITIEYDGTTVLPTELAEFVDSLGYKVVAQESGPTVDHL